MIALGRLQTKIENGERMGSVDKRQGALARREKRLAYLLLLPTFLLVFSIVLFPLIANFWISVKPVTLSDLRPPTLVVKERLRGNFHQCR